MDDFKERITSRKFQVTVLLHLISDVALFTGMADFTAWADFNWKLAGVYALGNGAEHWARNKSK